MQESKDIQLASFLFIMTVALWFDVGIKRYTTVPGNIPRANRCGLMQESKDIQQLKSAMLNDYVVV